MAGWRGHWQLIALTVLIIALWQTPLVLPLKLLIVFLHELSHVIAIILTGGEVVSLSVDPMQGGMVTSRGGSRFLSLSAGYVGSLLIGVLLFVVAIRTRWDKTIVMILGAVLVLVTLSYAYQVFALLFGLGTGAALIAVGWYLGREINDLILRVIGLSSMIYVPLDIFSDTIARSHLPSDARMLADEFWGPTLLWGALWLVVSLAVIAWCIRHVMGEESNIAFKWPGRPGGDRPAA